MSTMHIRAVNMAVKAVNIIAILSLICVQRPSIWPLAGMALLVLGPWGSPDFAISFKLSKYSAAIYGSTMSDVTELGKYLLQYSVHLLIVGEDADRKFLRKLSLRNDGFMRHIYEAADAALQLQDFYRQVSSPLLADVKFVYPANQVFIVLQDYPGIPSQG